MASLQGGKKMYGKTFCPLPNRLLCQFVVASFSLTTLAQAPSTADWNDDALNLHLSYPSDLTGANSSRVMHNGNLALFGVPADTDPNLAAAVHCLRPTLLLELPPGSASASLLLAELNIDCLTPADQANAKNLLIPMAEAVTKVPGMKTLAQSAWYNIGSQKVYMAGAEGQPSSQPVYAMGLATNWNNHLLVFYFSASTVEMLDRITKTTVRFGRSAAAAPLYPLNIVNASAPPSSPSQ
jgi:hypothetical protein